MLSQDAAFVVQLLGRMLNARFEAEEAALNISEDSRDSGPRLRSTATWGDWLYRTATRHRFPFVPNRPSADFTSW